MCLGGSDCKYILLFYWWYKKNNTKCDNGQTPALCLGLSLYIERGFLYMKNIGKVKIINAEPYRRKDGTTGSRCVGLTDDNNVCIFYRPAEEQPAKGTEYNMLLGYDSQLKAVVKYEKVG